MRALLFFAALLEFLPLGEGFTGLAFHSAGLITAAGLLPFRGIAQARGEFKLGVPGRIKLLPHLNTCLPGTSFSNLLRPPTSKRNSALVRSLSNDLTEVQNPDSEDQFQNLEAQIARVETQIASVEATIQAAEGKANAATDTNERDYWREKEKQLREKEKQLREEKKQLREKESDLRKLALQGGTAGASSTQLAPLAMRFLDNLESVKEQEFRNDDLANSAQVWTGSWLATGEMTSQFFVRPCFEPLLTAIKKCWERPRQRHVLLIGTPGTGKTFFHNFVARKLVEDPRRDFQVVLAVEGEYICVHPDGKRTVGASLADFRAFTAIQETVVLLDLYNKDSPPAGLICKVLVTSSLNRERYADFVNKYCVTLYFPLWTTAELNACRGTCFPDVSEKEMSERIVKWGGIIRWTIGDCCEASEQAFQAALAKLQFEEAVNTMRTGQVDDSKVSHRLLHFTVSEDSGFLGGSYMFASSYVCDLVLDRGARDSLWKVGELVSAMEAEPVAVLRGQLFEWVAHRVLTATKVLENARDLEDGSLRNYTLGSRLLVRFDSLAEVNEEQYGVPRSRRFPTLDSVAPPKLAFQMTTDINHGVGVNGLVEAVKALPGLQALVFVVPDNMAPGFPMKKYLAQHGKVYNKSLPPSVRKVKLLVYGVSLSFNLDS